MRSLASMAALGRLSAARQESMARSASGRVVEKDAPPQVGYLRDFRGNVVVTVAGADYEGIKNGPNVTAVPAATPTHGNTYTDGLGSALLYLGSTTSTTAWVAVQAMGEIDMAGAVLQGSVARTKRYVLAPIAGGGGAVAPVYLIWTP